MLHPPCLAPASRSPGRALVVFGLSMAGEVTGAIVLVGGVTIVLAVVDADLVDFLHCCLLPSPKREFFRRPSHSGSRVAKNSKNQEFWNSKTRRLCGRRRGLFHLAKVARSGES